MDKLYCEQLLEYILYANAQLNSNMLFHWSHGADNSNINI